MPVISQFFGIVIRMFFKEFGEHHLPHIHISYNEFQAVYDLEGNKLEGDFPKKQSKLVEAWIIIHSEELKSLWKLMQEGEDYFKIEPLK